VGDDCRTKHDWHDREGWRRALRHPDVVRVDCRGGTVRVRLRSGVELEWRCDDEPPA